jgi:WD40 repeat protein
LILWAHTLKVQCCDVTKDGRQLLSASQDQTIIVWNIETGEVIRKIRVI